MKNPAVHGWLILIILVLVVLIFISHLTKKEIVSKDSRSFVSGGIFGAKKAIK